VATQSKSSSKSSSSRTASKSSSSSSSSSNQAEKLEVKHTFRDVNGNEVHLTKGGDWFTSDELRAKTDPNTYGKG